ncbi:MAG: radical SAM protein [Candidatus Omnitrophica bacterium]|nr:radical SAM protein [Candidatus Omnitrophota bacterium]
MKILFVYKGRYQVRDSITIEYLSSIAKQYNCKTALVYDQDTFGITDNVFYFPLLNRLTSRQEDIAKKIIKENPDFVVFLDGFNRTKWNEAINKKIKQIKNKIRTINILSIKKESINLDYNYTLIGEAEYTFDKFLKDKIFNSKDGIYSFSGLANLDMLPLADKFLFSKYIDFKLSYMLYTSKGCLYNCSYCEETIYKNEFGGAYFRRRSPKNVISELEKAKKDFDIREIIYKDSVFTFDKEWLKEYLTLYREKINLPYKCFAKAEVFDEEIANLLKKSGCYCVEFGVQTFNEKIKKEILLRNESNQQLLAAFKICDRYNLPYDVDHLFGIPTESVKDHIEAARIYMNLKFLNRIKTHNLTFYPQAQIYNFAPQYIKNNKNYQADFFSILSGEKNIININKIFIKYFKVLPLLPKKINLFILKKNRLKIFTYFPNILILICMFLVAIKNKDRRFLIYLRLYLRKILLSFQ